MPVFLKELKQELQDDREKVGKNKDGSYKSTPPNIIGRLVKDYPALAVSKLTSRAVPRLEWLSYTGLVASESTGIKYKVSVQFQDMIFKDLETKQFNQEAVTKDKKKVFHRIPTAQRNQVRITCSCFTADTLIPLAEGKSVPIKDLVGLEKFHVYSFDQKEKRMVIGEGYNCEPKKMDYIYHVTLDNGHIVKCTGDHKFLTKSGDWVEAKDLLEGQSLEPLYRRKSSGGENYKMDGYEMVYQTHHMEDEFTHRIADKFNIQYTSQKISNGTVRHHIDFNKLNNSPLNIKRMDWLDHIKLHSQNMVGDKNPMRNPDTAAKVRKSNIANGSYTKTSKRMLLDNPMKKPDVVSRMLETTKRNGSRVGAEKNFRQDDPEVRRKMSESKIDKTIVHFHKCQEASRKLLTEGKHNFQSEAHNKLRKAKYAETCGMNLKENNKLWKKRFKLIAWLKSLPTGNTKLNKDFLRDEIGYPSFYNASCGVSTAVAKLDGLSYDKESKTVTKEDILYNHKVVSVAKTDDMEMTYCFTVKKHHNFVIDVDGGVDMSSGIVVHNCMDFRHRFMTQLAIFDAHIGAPLRYTRKTAAWPVGRPLANATDKIGFCKHVSSLLVHLKRKGLVKER